MSHFVKRAISIFLAIIMIFALAACSSNPTTPSTAGEGKLFTKPTEISIAISSASSWPYNANWKIWKYFQEATGATLKVTSIPDSDFDTKVSLMMASKGSLPDLIYFDTKGAADSYAASGALVSLTDNQDKMKYYTAFLNKFSEEDRTEMVRQRTSGDGKVYCAPVHGTETIQNLRTWMYRKDIFEKNHLKVPETIDELYTTAKKLKQLYPDSYPICIRGFLNSFEVIAPAWKNDLTLFAYYDFKAKKWCYGATQPEIKQIVELFLKMRTEGLVPPDLTTIATKSWEELVSTNRAFIMPEYIVRLDYFNLPNRAKNPGYTWASMPPPKANTPEGQHKIGRTNVNYKGYTVCNTGKKDRIDNAIKLLDWMYSDKASDLLSWGKKGETYTEEKGERKFILSDPSSSAMQEYGVATSGLYQELDPKAFEAAYSKEQAVESRKALQYGEKHANPICWVPLSPEDQKENAQYTELIDFTMEGISKFILGQEPMSNWDKFQKGLKDMGVDKMLQMYTRNYDRVTAASAAK